MTPFTSTRQIARCRRRDGYATVREWLVLSLPPSLQSATHHFTWLRRRPSVRAALRGVNAAVVGLLLAECSRLGEVRTRRVAVPVH